MKNKVKPRKTPDRDSKYMGLAWIHASFSKDPNTQIGSVIIDKHNNILGTGYNGPPSKIKDDSFSWERPEKYLYVKHAEDNAIDHSKATIEEFSECTLYVTGLPCKSCMLDIISKNINKVVYMDGLYDKNSSQTNQEDINSTHILAKEAGVELIKFTGDLNWLLEWTSNLKNKGVFNI